MTEPSASDRGAVRRWLDEYHRVLGAVVALLTIAGFLFAGVKLFFAQPAVSIFAGQTQLNLPPSFAADLDSVINAGAKRTGAGAAPVLRKVKRFIEDTRNYTIITISNNTSNSIRNVEMRIKDVYSLAGYAATSTSLLDEEQRGVRDSIHYDENGSLLRLRSIPRLPPKSAVNIWLWGFIPYSDMLAEDQIAVTYDGGAGQLVHRYQVEGLDAFIYRNSEILVILLLVLNLGLFQAALEHELRRRGRPSNPISPP